MDLRDRIQTDSILHALPAWDVSSRRLMGGRDIARVPGREAVLVHGSIPSLLSEGQAVPKDRLEGCVAYIRTRPIDVTVELTERDAVQTSESYPCVGSVSFQASPPEERGSLEAFAAAHVGGSGEQVYGPGDVAQQLRSALLARLRREVKSLPLEQIPTASESISKSLRADPGEGVLGALQTQLLTVGGSWALDLRPGAYCDEDETSFAEVRAEAEDMVKKQDDPASRLIHTVMTLHNSSPSFRLNVWFSRLRDRPATRGAIGAYAESTHKNAGVYQRGEAIALDVMCSQDAHLYLLDIDSAGELSLLFPNERHRENLIRGGETFRLPDAIPELFGGEGERWEIVPTAPSGPGRIKAIATLDPVELLPEVLGRSPLLYCREAAQGLPDVVEMAEKIRKLPPKQWADAACQFHVA